MMPIRIEGEGGELTIIADDEVVRFNSLPFRVERDTEARELAIRRVLESTPSLPLTTETLQRFMDIAIHNLGLDRRTARLDGSLSRPPSLPGHGDGLWLIDNAAIFIAPKTAYFLTSDLTRIAEQGLTGLAGCCLGSLLAGPGGESQVDISADDLDRLRVYYPFASNRAQRRVAALVEDETTRMIRVEGPPGTGKSLTIANLACHLAATGKTVLITSQKDKALDVVDEKLRSLGLAELPMTLRRHDKDSRRDLLERLGRIKKERAREEVEREVDAIASTAATAGQDYVNAAAEYMRAVESEEQLERAHRRFLMATGLKRLVRSAQLVLARRRARRLAPRATDDVATFAARKREELKSLALQALKVGREFAVAAATRQERQGLRELGQILQRNQTAARNFSLFDRLKNDPQRAVMLSKLLPVWIMAPEDAARLFPCQSGIFDVVIIDEASQVDLPSITPVVYRGKKVVVFGDTKQMQPRRFLFMNQAVITQAWQQHGMEKLDPDRWLYPTETSLLSLVTVRAEEETLLDEHFRSLPPIIAFSNGEWYGQQLRIMTDERQKQFGAPTEPVIALHYVEGGKISNGSQENQVEAMELVAHLKKLVASEDYKDASIGVICLFEEQASLVQELVAQHIGEDEWEEHALVVVTPDGFQGDERDVILYSLSWDNDLMPRQALSQRQRQHPHEQGMLNVAFTRARDEMHIFHSAPVETFGLADGRPGVLSRWLQHCAAIHAGGRAKPRQSRIGEVDSEFEAEVAAALRARGALVMHQYPACGFHIDLMCEKDDTRVAVECDGERYHLDEHGQPKIEDLEREAILRRAGWHIVRIPYRRWLADRDAVVESVLAALRGTEDGDAELLEPFSVSGVASDADLKRAAANTNQTGRSFRVSRTQDAILKALREGINAEHEWLSRVRDLLGMRRLTARRREEILREASELSPMGLVTIEDHEYFLTPSARSANIDVVHHLSHRRPIYRRRRRWRY
jgi:very-short-patch-repair endonuclease